MTKVAWTNTRGFNRYKMLSRQNYIVVVERIVVLAVSVLNMAPDVVGLAAVPVAFATISLTNCIASSERAKIQSPQTLVSQSISKK